MKVIIIGDILRPDNKGVSFQTLNIKWFYNLISWQVSQAVKTDVKMLLWDDKDGSFDSKKFYELNGLDISIENWAELFDSKQVSKASIAYFKTFFRDCVVVGFELPGVFIRLLDELKIYFVDFTIHPVRYLDDVFFGIRTNSPNTFGTLKSCKIEEELFYIQANIHKATISRMTQPRLLEKSCLFVGQTKVDKSLICNGRILSILDYLGTLDQIASKYNKIYFKPHPYTWGDEHIMSKLRGIKYIEFINENIYKLLCHENLDEVYSISSSVIYESTFFGKKSTYLYKNPIDLYSAENSEFSLWRFVPIYNEFYNPAFWSKLLAGTCEVNKCSGVHLPAKTSRLRTSLHNYWGYNFLDFELLYKSIEPNVQRALIDHLKNWIYRIPIVGRFVRTLLRTLRLFRKIDKRFFN